MTIEELKDLAGGVMEFALNYLRENESLDAMFQLVTRDGIDVIQIEGPLINSATAKKEISDRIRERIRSGDVQAVIFVSDTFYAETTVENQRIINRERLNVEQAHARGLCDKQEAILVTLETPIYQSLTRQIYQRFGKRIKPGKLLLDDSTMPSFGGATGRMFNFFDKNAKGTMDDKPLDIMVGMGKADTQ